jgi:hypothetical protein
MSRPRITWPDVALASVIGTALALLLFYHLGA